MCAHPVLCSPQREQSLACPSVLGSVIPFVVWPWHGMLPAAVTCYNELHAALLQRAHSWLVAGVFCLSLATHASTHRSSSTQHTYALLSVGFMLQALESTGPCVQGIRDIRLHNYLEFSAVTSAHTLHQGRLCGIPASRADVHGASWLSPEGKRTLNLFLSAAQQAAAGSVADIFQSSHFKAAMEEFGLPESVQVCSCTSASHAVCMRACCA